MLNRSDVVGGAAGARFDRERERFDRGELDVHRASRLVLLLAQPRHDGVVAAEHQVERHRQHGKPAEPAARRGRGGDRRERRAGQVARRAPDEVALPDAHDRLARRERDGAGDECRVDEEVERRHHRRGAHQRREARGVAAHHGGQRQARDPRCQRQAADAEDDAVQRVAAAAGAQRALRPAADRGDADGFRRAEREQRPEVHRVRQRQVGLAASERQVDLRGGGQHGEPEQHREQHGLVEAHLHRRDHERCGAGQHHGRHVDARAERQRPEGLDLLWIAAHASLGMCSRNAYAGDDVLRRRRQWWREGSARRAGRRRRPPDRSSCRAARRSS